MRLSIFSYIYWCFVSCRSSKRLIKIKSRTLCLGLKLLVISPKEMGIKVREQSTHNNKLFCFTSVMLYLSHGWYQWKLRNLLEQKWYGGPSNHVWQRNGWSGVMRAPPHSGRNWVTICQQQEPGTGWDWNVFPAVLHRALGPEEQQRGETQAQWL